MLMKFFFQSCHMSYQFHKHTVTTVFLDYSDKVKAFNRLCHSGCASLYVTGLLYEKCFLNNVSSLNSDQTERLFEKLQILTFFF